MPGRPNLIVCMCDQLRWCNVGCYGDPLCRTPAIDAIAAGGARFETAISNNPVCMPARSIVLSGQHSRTCATLHNAAWGDGIPVARVGLPQWPTERRQHFPDPTLPELLRDAGYRTHAIGKWHVEAWPDAIGFDRFAISANHHANSAQWFLQEKGRVYSPPGYAMDHELDVTESVLDEHGTDGEPFFVYLNFAAPHSPLLDAPDEYVNMYRDEDVELRGNVPEGFEPNDQQRHWSMWDFRWFRDRLPYCEVGEEVTMRRMMALYLGNTTWVDDKVARLRSAIRSRGLEENTVVLFTSDHGNNLGSHGRMGKERMTDEACRVPMCVAGPGIESGRTVNDRVASLVDLAPTLLGFAGVTPPAHMHGRDLGPAICGEADAPNTPADAHCFLEHVAESAVRTPTHTLWFDRDRETRQLGDHPAAFYDNTADPLQMSNLADGDEQADLREELAHAVRAWHAATPWREDN